MKMMKLLGAASVAALMAGAANAQLLLELADQNADYVAPAIEAPGYVIAEEVDFAVLPTLATNPAATTFALEVIATGSIPDGQNYFLTIELTNGVIAANLDGSEITSGASVSGGTVNAGGMIGDTSVRYLVRSDNSGSSLAASEDGFAIGLPIQISSCGDLGIAVTELETEAGGTPIDGGQAVLTTPVGMSNVPIAAVECDNAFTATLTPDAAFSQLDFGTGFTNFVAGAGTTDTNVLGDFALAIAPGVFVDMVGTAAAGPQVLGFEADIVLEDDTNIEDGTAAVAVGTLFADADVAPVANIISLDSDTPAAGADTGTFSLTLEGGATQPVMAQVVGAQNAILNLNTAIGLQASDPFTFADVEDLIYEGDYFGPFDWVADTNGRVNSIFRITGLSPLVAATQAQIVLENSRNGNNGVFPFVLAGADVEGSEIRMTSSSIEAITGPFSTADVTFVVSTTQDLDIDRLLSGPSTATVVPFGDDANSDSTPTPPTTPATTGNDDVGSF